MCTEGIRAGASNLQNALQNGVRQDRRTLVMLGLAVFLASSGRGMREVDKIASSPPIVA